MKLQLILGITFLMSGTNAMAGSVESGRELHNENCISCHQSMVGGDGSGIYTREDRKMDSYDTLRKQVMRCKTALGVPWPEHQIDDVIAYLNATFYKFEKK